MAAVSSKEAAAYLIDPMNAPEPSQETGPGSHFGSTFSASQSTPGSSSNAPSTSTPPPRTSLSSNNPFRDSVDGKSNRSPTTPPSKSGIIAHERSMSRSSQRSSPRQPFPSYRAEAFGDFQAPSRARSGSANQPPPSYDQATSPAHRHRRRTSSLTARYPGDQTHMPLDMIRKDSRKADRSPHLKKRHQPGPDTIDRLDPAIGGRAYHHEGPYDAALLARNTSYESAPIAALKTSNDEALKATPAENIKDAVERHKPLDGVAIVPPGMPDRFGRTYNYEEGADMMHEENTDGPGYKRWGGKDYAPDDLKGESEPAFSLDKALRAHKINDDGIEMQSRDPVHIAGDDGKYADMQIAASSRDSDANVKRSGSIRDGLKKRIGSLRKKHADNQ